MGEKPLFEVCIRIGGFKSSIWGKIALDKDQMGQWKIMNVWHKRLCCNKNFLSSSIHSMLENKHQNSEKIISFLSTQINVVANLIQVDFVEKEQLIH